RAEVERGGLEVVDGHAAALDGEEALFLRQATSQPAPGIAAVLAAPDRGRAAGTGARPALQRHDVNRIGVVRMDDDGEAEVGRQPLGDRAPGVAVVVAAQDADARTFGPAAMILHVEPARRIGMAGDLVHALAE